MQAAIPSNQTQKVKFKNGSTFKEANLPKSNQCLFGLAVAGCVSDPGAVGRSDKARPVARVAQG